MQENQGLKDTTASHCYRCHYSNDKSHLEIDIRVDINLYYSITPTTLLLQLDSDVYIRTLDSLCFCIIPGVELTLINNKYHPSICVVDNTLQILLGQIHLLISSDLTLWAYCWTQMCLDLEYIGGKESKRQSRKSPRSCLKISLIHRNYPFLLKSSLPLLLIANIQYDDRPLFGRVSTILYVVLNLLHDNWIQADPLAVITPVHEGILQLQSCCWLHFQTQRSFINYCYFVV